MTEYNIIKSILRFAMRFVFRIKTVGEENFVNDGAAIAAINHRSNWDAVVLGAVMPRPLGFMAKAELFENKLFAAFFKSIGAFPVHRGKSDITMVKTVLQRLKDGEIVAIFPEGTRVKEGEKPVEAKNGAVMFAIRSQVPVIPIKISGNYRWLSKITVTIGKPVVYEEFYGQKPSSDKMHELSENLMKTIKGLDK